MNRGRFGKTNWAWKIFQRRKSEEEEEAILLISSCQQHSSNCCISLIKRLTIDDNFASPFMPLFSCCSSAVHRLGKVSNVPSAESPKYSLSGDARLARRRQGIRTFPAAKGDRCDAIRQDVIDARRDVWLLARGAKEEIRECLVDSFDCSLILHHANFTISLFLALSCFFG